MGDTEARKQTMKQTQTDSEERKRKKRRVVESSDDESEEDEIERTNEKRDSEKTTTENQKQRKIRLLRRANRIYRKPSVKRENLLRKRRADRLDSESELVR